MEKPFVRVFYDLETTGTDYRKNCIHQIAGFVEIDGTIEDTFDIRLAPHERAKVEEEALRVGGVTVEQISSYPSWQQGYKDFMSVLRPLCDRYDKHDKLWLAGYNIRRFDDFFLRKLFELNGDTFFGSWFRPDTLDVMVLAGYALQKERRTLKNFKLGTVCRAVGIEFDEAQAHDALYDITKTRELYYALEPRYVLAGALM